MIADQHNITHFITNDNMSPHEIAIPVSVHVAPKNGWNIAKDHIKRHKYLIAIIDETFPTLHQHKEQLLK